MKFLAEYVMRGRFQAITAVVGFAGLSLILQPLSLLSGAALALVTLRVGPGAGFFIMAVATAIVGALTAWAADSPYLSLAFAVGLWLPVWILAVVLRATINLPLTLLVGTGLSLGGVLLLYLWLGNPTVLWEQVLDRLFSEAGMSTQMEQLRGELARSLTSLFAVFWFINAVGALLLGRWWQAMLYNPGGFKKEFLALHLSRWPAWVTVALSVWAMVADGGVGTLPTDLAVVSLLPFAVAGISLVHAWVEYKNASGWWLVPIYVLALVMLPQVLFTMALVGLSDSWVDWRRRWGGGPPAAPPPGREDGERLPPPEEKRDERDAPRVVA